MGILVQKYGGSSLATADRIRAVARRIIASSAEGQPIVVVVSAMGDTTDELISLARQLADEPSERELDLLLSTGEMISCTLVAMALRHLGRDAISLTGAQAGIKTDATYSRARIIALDPSRIHRELAAGRIVVVAGFQGITEEFDITTLGRGGSDTTAVALAAILRASRCEIYTDVDGVYTADPRIEPRARKLDEISYEEMLELAQQGARVMHPRAVELGSVYGVPIVVRSSFNENPGTLIHGDAAMELRNKVRGIAHDTDVAKITVVGVPDRPGIAAAVFQPLADASINVDVIVQNASIHGVTDLSFTVARGDLPRALRLVAPVSQEIHATDVVSSTDLAKVSIVGTG
ncbi:MAG: aspartate kinase, partial [Chloroflexi bacterium]|nr:aspartate kinase [Chloroflexota bacterium]